MRESRTYGSVRGRSAMRRPDRVHSAMSAPGHLRRFEHTQAASAVNQEAGIRLRRNI